MSLEGGLACEPATTWLRQLMSVWSVTGEWAPSSGDTAGMKLDAPFPASMGLQYYDSLDGMFAISSSQGVGHHPRDSDCSSVLRTIDITLRAFEQKCWGLLFKQACPAAHANRVGHGPGAALAWYLQSCAATRHSMLARDTRVLRRLILIRNRAPR